MDGKVYGAQQSLWTAPRRKIGRYSMVLSDDEFYARYPGNKPPHKALIMEYWTAYQVHLRIKSRNSCKKSRYLKKFFAHAEQHPADRQAVGDKLMSTGSGHGINFSYQRSHNTV